LAVFDVSSGRKLETQKAGWRARTDFMD